jgi:hypothetical protein
MTGMRTRMWTRKRLASHFTGLTHSSWNFRLAWAMHCAGVTPSSNQAR